MKKFISGLKNSSVRTDPTTVPSSGDDYYQSAKDWYSEIYESLAISRNHYRILSIALGVLLGLSMVLMTAMMPLKQYFYRLIEVNQQTGEVAQLKEIEGRQYAANWVVTRYFINQYVMNRHNYSFEDIRRTFNIALSMSNREIAGDYSKEILDTNPASPLNVLNREYYRETMVLGINKLNESTAIIRFDTITRHRTNKADFKKASYQAVIKWEFNNPAESLEDRDRNPLGFTVNYYQITPVNSQDN